jgi:hypothetical protein
VSDWGGCGWRFRLMCNALTILNPWPAGERSVLM